VAEVFEEVGDLRRRDAIEGQRRDIVLRKELGVGGFVAALRGAADDFAEEEKFVGMESVGRMAMKVAVEDGGEFGDANFVAGFFKDFASGGNGRRLPDVSPTAGEGPAAVFEFADE
jgi:threonine dehydratase